MYTQNCYPEVVWLYRLVVRSKDLQAKSLPSRSMTVSGFAFENLLEALFSSIKVILLYVKLGLGTLIILCAVDSSVPDSFSQTTE